MPHKNEKVYIASESEISSIGNSKLCSGPLRQLVAKLKERSFQNIYCDEGSSIISQLLTHSLID